MSWTINNNTDIDLTPFLTDVYPNIKHNFFRSGVYFAILHGFRGDLWTPTGTLYVKAKYILTYPCKFKAWISDGTTESYLGEKTVTNASYATFSFLIPSARLNTITKINNLKLKLQYSYTESGAKPRITYAYIRLAWEDWGGNQWNEDLYVNGFDATTDEWATKVGASPYINSDDDDTSYIQAEPNPPKTDAYYTFTNTVETGDIIDDFLFWAYSYDGQNYTIGDNIYQDYGSGNSFYIWYDGANKVYLYRTDWDSGGHCIQVGTISGNSISWGTKKNIETTYRYLEGICKTSNGRLWVVFAKTSSPYRLYVKYSDDEGDTWSSTTEVSSASNVNWNASVGVVPLDNSHVYIIYECYGSSPIMRGRWYDGTDFGTEEDTNIDYITWGTHPVCDGAGRVHMLASDTGGGDHDIYHNWRSAGLSGTWQATAEIIKAGNDGYSSQLIKNGNKVRAYYTDYVNGAGTHYHLYYREWDGSWGTEVDVGHIEEDPVNKSYYTSFRIPYSFDGNHLHITFTWQLETDSGGSFTTLGAGQYNGGSGGPIGIDIGDYYLDLFEIPILDVSLEQNCDIALRDVPLRTVGEVMDTGTYLIHTLTLRFSMRLSDSEKTTLETLFITHAEATVYLKQWTFIGWLREPDIVYEYETNRPWKATLTFDIYSYSYSGASVGTFTNSQLRLVGGTTLDYEDILDFSVSEETSVAIPNWVNQNPTIDTNVWNKKLKRIIYTVRETEYRLYQLLQMLTAASAITFYDYIHGPTNKTAWLTSIRADWNPIRKENVNAFVDAPWEVEFEVIVQN